MNISIKDAFIVAALSSAVGILQPSPASARPMVCDKVHYVYLNTEFKSLAKQYYATASVFTLSTESPEDIAAKHNGEMVGSFKSYVVNRYQTTLSRPFAIDVTDKTGTDFSSLSLISIEADPVAIKLFRDARIAPCGPAPE